MAVARMGRKTLSLWRGAFGTLMTSDVRPLRPRLVIRVARDGSLDFAASSDVEVILVGTGFGDFRAYPNVKVGIEDVRRILIEAAEDPKAPSKSKRRAG